MSTYDDFDGVWFTIEAICLYHQEVLPHLSFVVVDNHPEGPAAEALQALGGYVANYRYVPFTGFRGTAVRDLVFRETDADVVCCMDSHVLLAPGALAAVRAWFAQHPDSLDLVQGPILWDDLRSGATHMEAEWRDGMYGTWDDDPRRRKADGEPFEISMHGLGLFACRRAAWPGLNPRFRGFGGEEGYLHEQFRRRGGRVLCHPAIRWAHRFGRPAGPAYANTWEDRVRNYVIGWSQLGWDLDPVEAHFRALLGGAANRIWPVARAQADHPLSRFDAVFCVDAGGESCAAHAHPDAVSWRVERVAPGPWADRELRRMTAWQRAISEASRRGYESALLIDAGARVIDPAPAATLDDVGWDVCVLATEGLDGRVVALHRRAFGQMLRDLRDDADGHAEFLHTWGDLDSYLEQRVSHGVLAAGGAPFARPADARLTLSPGVETRAGDGGLTVRAPSTEKLYDLNESAALVLGLCDGRRTVTEIAAQLAAELTLSATPIAEVSTCVAQLLHAGVLTLNGRHQPLSPA
jgi:hypothetical protein